MASWLFVFLLFLAGARAAQIDEPLFKNPENVAGKYAFQKGLRPKGDGLGFAAVVTLRANGGNCRAEKVGCPGDSGGPIFLKDSSVVAIMQGQERRRNLGVFPVYKGVHTRLDGPGVKPWLSRVLAEPADEEKIEFLFDFNPNSALLHPGLLWREAGGELELTDAGRDRFSELREQYDRRKQLLARGYLACSQRFAQWLWQSARWKQALEARIGQGGPGVVTLGEAYYAHPALARDAELAAEFDRFVEPKRVSRLDADTLARLNAAQLAAISDWIPGNALFHQLERGDAVFLSDNSFGDVYYWRVLPTGLVVRGKIGRNAYDRFPDPELVILNSNVARQFGQGPFTAGQTKREDLLRLPVR